MMYVNFEAGNKEYKLRLSIRNTVALERQLGCNPLAIFGNGDEIPTITTMITILHSSLQHFHHGISLMDAQDIFGMWLEEGHAVVDFLPVIIDIYKVSGIIQKDSDEKN